MSENPNWKDYWETTKMDRHYQAKLSREGYRPEPGRQVVAVWAKTLSSGATRSYLLWSSAELVQRTIRGQDTGGWAEGKRFTKYSNQLLIDIVIDVGTPHGMPPSQLVVQHFAMPQCLS